MGKVFLHAPALSQFGRANSSYLALSYETALPSVSLFGKEKIEFLILSSFSPDRYTGEFHLAAKLASALGIQHAFAIRTETASSAGASGFQLGVNLILSGRFKHGLVVATEIMSQLDRESNNLLLGSVLSEEQRRFQMSMAQGGAMITRRYLHNYGYKEEDLFYISKKLHDNGLSNPKAQIRKAVTREIYETQPKIASPLGLYDIAPLSDGSSAIILSQDSSPFSVRGLGHGTASFFPNAEPSFSASKTSFERAYQDAGVSPKDIQIAELHDAFTPFELVLSEDAGLFPRGEALRRLISGVTHPTGELPINASGGLKSRGHPVGASGLAQIVELMHWMEKRDLGLGMVHSIGGLATNNFTTLIERN